MSGHDRWKSDPLLLRQQLIAKYSASAKPSLIAAISDTHGKLAWTETLLGFAEPGLNDRKCDL